MSGRVVLLALALLVLAALLGITVGWLGGVQAAYCAVWLVAIERTIGVGVLVRFDPWRPVSRRARRRRVVLIAAGTIATCAVGGAGLGYAAVKTGEAWFLICLVYLLATLYSVWAVSFIKSYGTEEVIEVRVRE